MSLGLVEERRMSATLAQRLVPRLVTLRVVHGLEVVQVEIGHGDGMVPAPAQRQNPVAFLMKGTDVEQRRQRVCAAERAFPDEGPVRGFGG